VAERALLLFAKPAVAGRVKSRLVGGRVSAAGAAALQAAFLSDLVGRFSGGPWRLVPCWGLAPEEAIPPWPAGGVRQADGDLGARLHAAFRSVAPGARFAAAIGSDLPDLPLDAVRAAFAALERGSDLALGPAEDGGYYLIALRPAAAPARLFESIPWGGPRVLAATLACAAVLGLETALLPRARDVDTAADLDALAARLAAAPHSICPATRAALAALGWTIAACAS
jgi:hypothetical protein